MYIRTVLVLLAMLTMQMKHGRTLQIWLLPALRRSRRMTSEVFQTVYRHCRRLRWQRRVFTYRRVPAGVRSWAVRGGTARSNAAAISDAVYDDVRVLLTALYFFLVFFLWDDELSATKS